MAITTYAELTTAITNWTHRSDLSAYLADFVALAEARINREVRSPEMETALSSAISGTTLTAPTGFLELRNAYVDTSPATPLKVVSPAMIYEKYPERSSTGVPEYIAYDAGSFIFGPAPDSTYTIKGNYYKKQGPLSSAVYDLFSNHPDLFLFASLVEAYIFLRNDAEAARWDARYQTAKASVMNRNESVHFGGGMVMVVA